VEIHESWQPMVSITNTTCGSSRHHQDDDPLLFISSFMSSMDPWHVSFCPHFLHFCHTWQHFSDMWKLTGCIYQITSCNADIGQHQNPQSPAPAPVVPTCQHCVYMDTITGLSALRKKSSSVDLLLLFKRRSIFVFGWKSSSSWLVAFPTNTV